MTITEFIEDNIDWDQDNVNNDAFNDYVENKYLNDVQLYTDGSRMKALEGTYTTAAGVYIPSEKLSVACRLQPLHSIITAKLIVIHKVLELLQEKYINNNNNNVACTASQVS